MIKVRLFSIMVIGLAGLVLTSFLQEKPIIKYWQTTTIESSAADKPFKVQAYRDSITKDTLFLQKAKDNTPLYYYKKVKGEVCHNKECRLLDIVLYWNITGRYLGFELPKGEFLSKYDHKPFTKNEYQQLHSLLADESLPLDKVSFEELLDQPQNTQENVDVLSGATSKNITNMVVKGAAYTTYKLWNSVNGNTMDMASELTKKQLTPALLDRILNSKDISDKFWVLEQINTVSELTPELEKTILDIISAEDYYLAYSALNAINSNHLKSTELQNRLFVIYQNSNHSIKKSILKKFMEAPFLSPQIIRTSRNLLPQLNGQQLDGLLKLYNKHNINDVKTCTEVAKILKKENTYISKKAYSFLIGRQIKDNKIIQLLNHYKNQVLESN